MGIEQDNWVATSMKGCVGMHWTACERQQYFWLEIQRPSGPAIDAAARDAVRVRRTISHERASTTKELLTEPYCNRRSLWI